MPGPKKNTAFTFNVALTSQADTKLFKTSPTLAAGDITVSKDGGDFANIGTLPTQIQTTGVLPIALTADEMNADRVVVRFSDAAGAEWCDLIVSINTETGTISEIAGYTDDIGIAGAGLTALGDTRLANLDAAVSTRSTYAGGAVASVTGAVGSVTGAVGSVTGNVGGNVVGSVGSVAGNVVGSVGSVTGLTASNLDATVSSRAVAGNAMTLTAAYDAAKTAAQAGEAAAAVAGLSTFAPATDEVETGITWAEWAKVLGSVLAGVASGGGTTTVVFKALDNSGTTRVTATVDANGNRSAVTLSL
jgi:hypothetical protein